MVTVIAIILTLLAADGGTREETIDVTMTDAECQEFGPVLAQDFRPAEGERVVGWHCLEGAIL